MAGVSINDSVTNQTGVPMIFALPFASFPAAGVPFRIGFRTDAPYGIYLDNGSAFILIAEISGGGVLSLAAIGSTANANGGTIAGTVLNLQPASASFGGAVTTSAQTFAGNKTLTGITVIADGSNLGTPATLIGTNINGNANSLNIGGNAATVTTNANLTGVITSVGNATSVANQTGTGSVIVMNTSPTLITPAIGTATATSLTTPALTVSLVSGAFAPFASAILANQSTAISLGYRDSSGGHNMAKIFGQRTNDGSGRSAIIIAVNAVDNDTDATVSDAKITISGTTGNITLASALSGTSATFSGTLGINGTADNVTSGTYTPTAANISNTSARSAYLAQYIRIGNVVTVSGQALITSVAVASTEISLTLPISSTFASVIQASGTANNIGTAGIITSISSTTTVSLRFTAPSAPSLFLFVYQYSYQII